jgi:superkiller protein 3
MTSNNANLYSNLGIALAQQMKFDKAVQEFEHALVIRPASSDIETNLGYALAAQGKLGEAIAHFEKALSLDPLNKMTKEYLDRAKELLKKQDK